MRLAVEVQSPNHWTARSVGFKSSESEVAAYLPAPPKV